MLEPPYCSGAVMPSRPRSPKRFQRSAGNRFAFSTSAARGATSASTKARTVSRSMPMSSPRSKSMLGMFKAIPPDFLSAPNLPPPGRRGGRKGCIFRQVWRGFSKRSSMPFQAATATPRRAMTPAAFVRGVVAAYARYGRDPAEALGKGQVTEDLVQSADARVTAAQFEALAGHAMRELDDEALGWFSRRLPWGTYGMLCRASITAPTLEVALKRWCRHHRLLTEDVLFELSLDADTATIRVREQRDLGAFREFCLVTLLRYVL